MRIQSLSRRRGFTLIELLTVIAIIGILAALSFPVLALVKKKAAVAASKTSFITMCTAVEQYKSEYGTYPYLNGKYNTTSDTVVVLNTTAVVAEFVKSLSGKQPIWDGAGALSTGTGGDARKYNRNAKAFYDFPTDVLKMDDSGGYAKLLTDRFGNTTLNLVMDTDGNGVVKPTETSGLTPASDYGIDTNGNINKRVIIYTLKAGNADYENILSWQ